MPEEGVPLTPSEGILTDEEVVRLCKLFANHGVNKVRFTGGEPTLRKNLPELIHQIHTTSPTIKTIAMTSNGIVLGRQLVRLKEAGLTALNISLDTLDPNL